MAVASKWQSWVPTQTEVVPVAAVHYIQLWLSVHRPLCSEHLHESTAHTWLPITLTCEAFKSNSPPRIISLTYKMGPIPPISQHS